jgi:ABC-type polysaccharide/polyol phosphate transport system ATPase subunit
MWKASSVEFQGNRLDRIHMNPSIAVAARALCKSFRVERRRNGASGDDPRRRRVGRRARFDALADISFDIARGRTLGVVGANGSGKTTLLKILAGVMQPDSGSLEINGSLGALLEVGAGFHPDLTGEENVYLQASLQGMRAVETRRLLPRIIEFAELERFMDMPVKHYSSGMIVRLGFAIAAQLRPEILLLDETFAVGDARFQARALGRIRQLKAEGVTLVMVSHDPELLLELADEAIWLDRGRSIERGEPRAVLANYARTCGPPPAPAERFRAALAAGGAGLPPRPERPAVRIVSAEMTSGDRPDLTLESGDPLSVRVEFEIAEPEAASRAKLIVYFRREDGLIAAQAAVPLADSPAAGRRRLELDFDPIALGQGEYAVTLACVLGEESDWTESIDYLTIDRALRITTPPPYDFRVVARIPAEWERIDA